MVKHTRPVLRLSPTQRFETGLIATVVDTATGEVATQQFMGERPIHLLVAWCDWLGPAWKVRTISTPASIFSDLVNDGRKMPPQGGRGGNAEGTPLGRIGRPDLIEMPLLRHGRGATEVRARRRRDHD